MSCFPAFETTSVVDPNTLNFYPDPEFWPNLDSDLDPYGYFINFEKNVKNIYWGKNVSLKKVFLNYKKIMVSAEIFSFVESLNGEFLPSIIHLWPPIYPTVTCVDPISEYGSGSTKMLNTDPIWIRIHNPWDNWALKKVFTPIRITQTAQTL